MKFRSGEILSALLFTHKKRVYESDLARTASKSSMCNKLMVGIGVAIIIITAITIWLSYRDMVNHYKVDFTPAPNYVVDLADLIGYNAKGEKIILKNKSAYYKAVLCNRKSDAEYYNMLGEIVDRFQLGTLGVIGSLLFYPLPAFTTEYSICLCSRIINISDLCFRQ